MSLFSSSPVSSFVTGRQMQTHLFPLSCSAGAASKKLASSILLARAASKKPCSIGLAWGVRPAAPVAPVVAWAFSRGRSSAAFSVRRGLLDLAWRGWRSATFFDRRGTNEAWREGLGTRQAWVVRNRGSRI